MASSITNPSSPADGGPSSLTAVRASRLSVAPAP